MKKRLVYIIVFAIVAACSSMDESAGFVVFSDASDFSISQQEWVGDFADYPTGPDDSAFYELQFEYTNRPSNLGSSQKAILLSGNNHSDDLFMFIKKKISGLRPNTNFTLVFEIQVASNAEKNTSGIGGSPGESVFLKAGASSVEPMKVVNGNFFRLNIDKGNQSNGGADMKVIGNIAVNSAEYDVITLNNSSQSTQFTAQSNSQGELWLIVGTDSGFEGTTTLYYTNINVVFSTSN